MNAKQTLSAIGILVVLLVIAAGLSLFSQTPADTSAQKSPILGGVATTTGDYEYIENAPYYSVDVVYPATAPLESAASAKVTRTIEQALADAIDQFKKDGNFANLTSEDIQIQGLGNDRKYILGAEYKRYQSANTVSYVFTTYEDTLGAHSNSFYRTFVFDNNGTQLQLNDLFVSGAPYLDRLSKESYKQIAAELTSRAGTPTPDMLDTVRLGTEPSPEALQFFYIDGDTLGLLFPPYQVASYAAGSFEVRVPLSSLSDILKPNVQ